MSKKKILSIGLKVDHPNVTYDNFTHFRSILEFDIILFDPEIILSEFIRQYPTGNFMPSEKISQFNLACEERDREIKQFLNLERTIYINMCSPIEFEQSGRKQRISFNPLSFFGIKNIRARKGSGIDITFKGDNLYNDFWDKVDGIMYYNAYLVDSDMIADAKPIFYQGNTSNIVGVQFKVGNCYVLGLPYPNLSNPFYIGQFIDALLELDEKLHIISGEIALPEWVNLYRLPGEEDAIKAINKDEQDIIKLQGKIKEDQLNYSNIRSFKSLITESGDNLVSKVRDVFILLGCDPIDVEAGRDDLLFKWKDKYICIEVKGVDGSAAEKHAAQLEKYVALQIDKKSIYPKGVLIVNAFRKTPLEERDPPIFPEQMMEYSISRKHCLISGLQMLCIYQNIITKPESKEGIMQQILDTVGRYDKYNNWRSIIKKTSNTQEL